MAAPTFFTGRREGVFCHERIWNNYIEIQWKSMQVIFIILLCTRGYNFLCDPTRQHEVWRKILLQADLIKRLTACIYASWWWKQNSTILRIRPNLMRKWPKWNEITWRIWLWVYQLTVCHLIMYLPVKQGLAINFFSCWYCCCESIWNNYVEIHCKSTQVLIIIPYCT